MSDLLEKARSQAAAGNYKAAARSLQASRLVVDTAAQKGNLAPIREFREVAMVVRDHVQGSFCEDCDAAIRHSDTVLAWAHEKGLDLHDGALASLRGCYVVGVAGLALSPDSERPLDLVFTDDRVLLVPRGDGSPDEITDLGWVGLSVEIGGAGLVQKGGRLIGGGFGLVGAAAGIATASMINALTRKTGMDTVVHLETPTAELFLHYGSETPDALRRTLSPVFLKLRQVAPSSDASAAPTGDHVVDRLHKLADLLDRNLITQEEFTQLKADLIGQLS